MAANRIVTDDVILSHLSAGKSQRATATELGVSRSRVRTAHQRAARVSPDGQDSPSYASFSKAFGLTLREGVPRSRILNDATAKAGGPLKATGRFFAFDEPSGMSRNWKASIFTDADIEDMPVSRMFALLLSGSPEVSKGAHDFVRMFNPGNEIHAYKPGTEDIDERAEAALSEFRDTLKRYYISESVMFSRMAMSLFSRGAILAEVVLDENGRTPVDLVIADPSVITFRREKDPIRGWYWQMGQWVGKKWVPLDYETIAYVPHDPLPDSPFGRPLIMPALFPALFLMGFLQDLRRVVANAGYDRIALTVDVPALYETAKALSRNGTVKQEDFVSFLEDVKRAIGEDWRSMEPGDALVKDSNVRAESIGGNLSQMNPAGLTGVIEALERMCVKALKTIPLLQGVTEGGLGDANANRQWEMLVATIKDQQHLAEDLLGRLLGVALQAQGFVADVRVRFAELRAAEMLRDAQVEQLTIENAERTMALGYRTPREAAVHATGFVSDAVEATYDDPDGSASEGADITNTDTGVKGGAPDAANVDSERARAAEPRYLNTAPEVNAFDEEEAVRVFNEVMPAWAGILDAEPEDEVA